MLLTSPGSSAGNSGKTLSPVASPVERIDGRSADSSVYLLSYCDHDRVSVVSVSDHVVVRGGGGPRY